MAQKEIELILLRQWASYLEMPIYVVDPDGHYVYFNEPAGEILGRRFTVPDPMPADELDSIFTTENLDGTRLDAKDLPINIARTQRRPAHLPFRIKGLDDVWRTLEVTAFPITGRGGRNLGAVAIFWRAEDQ